MGILDKWEYICVWGLDWVGLGRVGVGRSRFIRGWEGVCREVIPIIPFFFPCEKAVSGL